MKSKVDQLVAAGGLKFAIASVGALGICHTILLLQLAADGHQPSSAKMLPTEAGNYYQLAAYYISALYFVLWGIFTGTIRQLIPAEKQRQNSRQLWTQVGCAYAIPLTMCMIVPEIIVYQLWGHAALKYTFLIGGLITVILQNTLITISVKRLHSVSTTRALGVTLVGYFCQALPATMLIR